MPDEITFTCAQCGYDGTNVGKLKTANPPLDLTPFFEGFRLMELVERTWEFTVEDRTIIADTDTDQMDDESGDGYFLLCGACLHRNPLPEGLGIDFL